MTYLQADRGILIAYVTTRRTEWNRGNRQSTLMRVFRRSSISVGHRRKYRVELRKRKVLKPLVVHC